VEAFAFSQSFLCCRNNDKILDGKDGFVKLDFSKKFGVSQSRNDRLKSMDALSTKI